MRVLLSLIAVGLMATAANAQSWNGCYGGVHLGYASQTGEVSAGGFAVNLGAQGAQYGVLGGCDVQMDKLVVGAWGDYSWGSDWEVASGPGGKLELGYDGRWAVGVRGGLLLSEKTLAYGKIGWTEADVGGITADGIVWGGGLETQVAQNVYMAADYSYVDYDTVTFGPVSVDADEHIGRLELKYKFNWSPVSQVSKALK